MTKALAYGKEAEHRYRNNAGEEIEWKFDTVEILCRLEAESLADGLEVISRFLKQSEVISLKTPFEA